MEIKVGDKVRVREDAPRMYLRTMSTKFLGAECGVFEIIDGNAVIASGRDYIAIPLKYLIKVEEEKKETKFKVNDVVRTVFNEITHVTSVLENGNYYLYGMGNEYPEDSLTLVEPYTEPTEEKTPEVTRKSPSEAENSSEMNGSEAETTRKSPSEKKNGSITIPIEADLTDSFWAAYTADLAKEIALKVANKFNAPEQAAEYAVKVAKAVAEGLKKQ